jgi:hypothetical protein
MNQQDYEEQFRLYLMNKIKKQKLNFGDNYIKDKISRLRKLVKILGLTKLLNINEENYTKLIDLVIKYFSTDPLAVNSRNKKYMDYLVVLRLAFEMMNNGKIAPIYTHYAGLKIKK